MIRRLLRAHGDLLMNAVFCAVAIGFVLLGYGDSGSDRPDTDDGWPEGSFRAAPVDEAAERLAAVLRDEGADVLVAREGVAPVGMAWPTRAVR